MFLFLSFLATTDIIKAAEEIEDRDAQEAQKALEAQEARKIIQAAAVSGCINKKRILLSEEKAQIKRAKKVQRAAEKSAAASSSTVAQKSNFNSCLFTNFIIFHFFRQFQ